MRDDRVDARSAAVKHAAASSPATIAVRGSAS
jgi:hypothetical protein